MLLRGGRAVPAAAAHRYDSELIIRTWAPHRLLHPPPREVRREKLDEVVDEAAQVRVAPHRDASHTRLEQVARIDEPQAGVTSWVERHFREDAHPDAELDVSLDYVGIHGSQCDIHLQAARLERFLDRRLR